jgi:hypothetical protein
MQGYPVFRMPTESPWPTLGEAVNPQVGLIFRRTTRLSRSFYLEVNDASTINVKTSMAGPQEVPELKVREHPPST